MSNVKRFRIIKFKSKPIFSAKNIAMSFGDRVILRKVDVNLNKGEIIAEAKSENIEAKYNENTNSARENKIFGSPSFIVKNEVFWGDDRMEDAIKWSLK